MSSKHVIIVIISEILFTQIITLRFIFPKCWIGCKERRVNCCLLYLVDRYKKRFHKFDKESKGFITTVDVQQVLEVSFLSLLLPLISLSVLLSSITFVVSFFSSYRTIFLSASLSFLFTYLHYVIDPWSCFSSLQSINVHIDENALHEILNEVDLNKNGQIEIDEFLQVCNMQTVISATEDRHLITNHFPLTFQPITKFSTVEFTCTFISACTYLLLNTKLSVITRKRAQIITV